MHINEKTIFRKYLDLFHAETTGKYINLINTIRNDKNPEIRKKANDDLLTLFDLNHVSEFHRYVIRENNKEMIKQYENKMRKSGKKPYAIHPISVEYLLSSLGLGVAILIGAGNHDNIESDIAEQKRKGNAYLQNIETFTNYRMVREYKTLTNVYKKAALRMKKNDTSSLEKVSIVDKKIIFHTCLLIQKVTRYESDKNYPLSMDKIIDENINIANQKFTLMFLEYLKDIKNDDSLTESDLDNFNDELTLSKEETFNIIIDAFLVKLGDRISNSVDTYEKQSFSDKITDLFKNFIVIDLLRNYLKEHTHIQNYIGQFRYDALILLSDLLLYVSNERLNEERKKFDDANQNNESFQKWKNDTDIEEKIKKYAVDGGFRVVDPEVNDDIITGLVVSLFNKTLNKDASVKNLLNCDPMLQYRALASMTGIFREYDNPDFTIRNINIIRNYVANQKDGSI